MNIQLGCFSEDEDEGAHDAESSEVFTKNKELCAVLVCLLRVLANMFLVEKVGRAYCLRRDMLDVLLRLLISGREDEELTLHTSAALTNITYYTLGVRLL
jgi:hypothetical protein